MCYHHKGQSALEHVALTLKHSTAVENLHLPGVEFYVSGTTRHAKTQHALIETFFVLLVKARQ